MTSKVQGGVSNYSVNARGFASVQFEDSYSHQGSLRESSALGNVWLGVDDAELTLHLSRENVRMLLPFLQNFVNDGTILGDNWDSEERRLVVELHKTKLPVVDADGNVEGFVGGSSDDEEDDEEDEEEYRKQTQKRQRSDDGAASGMVCAIKAPIAERKNTEEETKEK